jgi:hypothetical protein
MLRGARASSETSASRPPVEAHRLMSFERAEPLVVRMRQRGVLWVIARPYFGGANELRTHGLARDCYCCGLRTLCRNSDNQRLRLLGLGRRLPYLAWCSLPAQEVFQTGNYGIPRATSCCDRGGLRRNPNSQRLRLLGFGSRLSRPTQRHQLCGMKVDPAMTMPRWRASSTRSNRARPSPALCNTGRSQT